MKSIPKSLICAKLSQEDYDMQLRLTIAVPFEFCSEPSFIFRQHDLLRGAKAIRYSDEQRSKVFLNFDQRVEHKYESACH